MSYGNYEFRYVRGHIEVFLNGVFQFSADTVSEAQEELQEQTGSEGGFDKQGRHG